MTESEAGKAEKAFIEEASRGRGVHWVIAVIALVCAVLGLTYAYWSDQQTTASKLTRDRAELRRGAEERAELRRELDIVKADYENRKIQFPPSANPPTTTTTSTTVAVPASKAVAKVTTPKVTSTTTTTTRPVPSSSTTTTTVRPTTTSQPPPSTTTSSSPPTTVCRVPVTVGKGPCLL